MLRDDAPGKNWAGNYEYRARGLHRPRSLDEARDAIAASSSVRVLGSRHSFNDIADSEELVSFEDMPGDIAFDREAGTVSLGAATTYGELAEALNDEGFALHNLASLPHISVAGAVATATHGSGDGNKNLASAVAGFEMVTSEGEVVEVSRGDADFEGMVVGLGALGAVVRVSLDVEPIYEVRQRVFEGLRWDALFENFDDITARGYSVSVFTRWAEDVDQVWVKSRADELEDADDDLFGAVAAKENRHPILELDSSPCTPQMGEPGLWSDRLPHFRMGFTPSSGDELQSEFLVPRRNAPEAIKTVRDLSEDIRPILQISEIRTVAADDFWMSMSHGEDTVGIHFTWKPDRDAVEAMLERIEAALAPFEARPHWGKLFTAKAADIAPLYEKLPDFVRLMERLDPRGAFRNPWLETHVIGG